MQAAEAVGSVVTRTPTATADKAKPVKSETDIPAMPIADAEEEPALTEAQDVAPAVGWKPSSPAKAEDDLQKTMDDARRKLAEIDALLGKTIQ